MGGPFFLASALRTSTAAEALATIREPPDQFSAVRS